MKLSVRFQWDKFVPVLVVVTLVVGSFWNDKFLTTSNMSFLIQSIGEIMLIAFPMTLLIIAGEIDLSVSSTAALSSCMLGFVWQHSGSIPLAVVSALATGLVCGAINGLLVTRLGLQSLAVTIGTLALYRGLCYVLLGDDQLTPFPTSFTSLNYKGLFGTWVPYVTLPLVVLGLGFGVVLHASRFGRWVFAIGQSKDAARFVGIPVRRSVLTLFISNGLMAGAAGVVYTIRFASARPDGAVGMELEVIAAALFAGVSIFGGVGTMWAVASAVVFLGSIRSLLRLNGATANELTIVTGSLLLISVVVPAIAARFAERRHPHMSSPMNRGQPAPTVGVEPIELQSSMTSNPIHTHNQTQTHPHQPTNNPIHSVHPTSQP
jgi:rhamnose transport system permease protein